MATQHLILVPLGLSLLADVNGELPVFKSVPTTVKTHEHDTVLLPCYIDNLGANSVRWWKDETLVVDTGNADVAIPANIRLFPGNHTLEVSDLGPTDTGEYICQVVRPEPWGPLNQVHAIEVLYPPSVKTVPESGVIEVELNNEVSMGCVTTGVPQPVITWLFEGEEMQLLNNRATLKFKVTSRSMAGNYQCIASNGVGDIVSAVITLKTLYPPEVGADRLWVHASPGVRAEMSCMVHASPSAKVEWFQEGKPVAIGQRIVTHKIGDNHLLIIRNVRTSDLGFFTCRATNPLGRSHQVIHLSGIANAAVFKKGLKQQFASNYTLVWEVDSYSPIIEYNLLFRKDQLSPQPGGGDWSKLIIPSDNYSPGPIHSQAYTVTGLEPATLYEASVLSRNRFGWSRPSNIHRFTTLGIEMGTDDIAETEDEIATNTIQNVISAEFGSSVLHTNISRNDGVTLQSISFIASLAVMKIVRFC